MTSPASTGRSPDELYRLIHEYFAAIDLPQGLTAPQVTSYLQHLEAQGYSRAGLEGAWTDIELFCAYLEAHPDARRIDQLEPWEISRFAFRFLEKEVYDPEAESPDRKERLLSTLVSFLTFLEQQGFVESSSKIAEAFDRIFESDPPEPIEPPPLEATDRLGWLNGPVTGLAHAITASDLWLALVRDTDFDGEWQQLLIHLDAAPIPSAEAKSRAAQRLASIKSQDELDPIDMMGDEKPGPMMLERARKYFYEEEDIRDEIPAVLD